MKKQTFAAVATLATTMFLSQGAMGQDQADKPDASADQSDKQDDQSDKQDQAGSSAQQAGERAGQSGARAGQGQMSMDQKFAKHAMMINQFEIQAGQLVQKQGEDPNVKKLAQMIVKDHQQAQQKLQQATQEMQQGQASEQKQLGPVHQAMLQELQKKQGMEFDRAFLYGNIAGHTKAVLMFRDAARECQNEQLKQYAQQTLPTLKQRLEQAKQIAQYDEAESAGATERGSGRPKDSGTGTDTSGTDTQNRRGAGKKDTGSGSSTDSGSSGRSPSR